MTHRLSYGSRAEIWGVSWRAKVFLVLAVLVGVSRIAAAQEPIAQPKMGSASGSDAPRWPTVPAIPEQFAPPQEAFASFPEQAEAAPPVQSVCQVNLANVAEFRPLPVLVGPGECGASDAVLLQAGILPDQTKVVIAPPATLRCTMAQEVTQWIREDVAPAASKLGSSLRGLDDLDSYECRGRNRNPGATLSEYARANALDVYDFKLANGRAVVLTDVTIAKDWREAIKSAACARFSTVLGPGSDGYHEQHIHLDLAERHNNYRICEWDVRELIAQAPETAPLPPETVPLPRPRPKVVAEKLLSFSE
jgi:hypothetical protein